MSNNSPIKLPYTVAFFLPPDARDFLANFRRKIEPFILKFDDLEIAHLTIKYLGFPSERLSEEHILSLLPNIARISRSFVPLTASLHGLDLFPGNPETEPVLYLKVKSCQKLCDFHEALRSGLGKAIDEFPRTDGHNYRPHITMSKKLDPLHLKQIRKCMFRSRRMARKVVKLTDLVLLTPSAIYPIFSNL